LNAELNATAPGQAFLTAEWRHLALLNYEVDAALLAPYVPKGVQLDFWRGRTYASLVGFLFLNTRVRGMAIPFHRDFEEVNLRFYVRRGDRRGVVFIREIVPRRAIAWVARAMYGENYVRLAMRHAIAAAKIEYGWRYGGQWNRIAVSTGGPPQPFSPGSHEEFIAEHYWGYARRSAKATDEYRVEHPPWRTQASAAAGFEGSVAGLYPRQFEFLNQRAPDTAFVADGSAVTVSRGRRLPPAN
jgi:uncharacterized protein